MATANDSSTIRVINPFDNIDNSSNDVNDSQEIVAERKKKSFWHKIYNGIFKHYEESTRNKRKSLLFKKNHAQTNVNNNNEQDVAIAIKIPTGLAHEKTDIIIELERNRESINNIQQSNENLHRSTYFPCIEEKIDRAVFAGTIKVPSSINLEKITSMPLFLFDSAQEIPTTMQSNFKYMSKIKPIKKSLSEKVDGSTLFGELHLKIIFQNKHPFFKNKSLSKKSVKGNKLECSFIMNVPNKSQDNQPETTITSPMRQCSTKENELELLHSNSITSTTSKEDALSLRHTSSTNFIDNGILESRKLNDESQSLTPSHSERILSSYNQNRSSIGSIISLTSKSSINTSKIQVPSNSPLFSEDVTITNNSTSEIIPEGDNNSNEVTSPIKDSLTKVQLTDVRDRTDLNGELSENVEFGGVKKNLKNIINGQNLNCTLKNTKNIIKTLESNNNNNNNNTTTKTGIQTIQKIYSSSLTLLNSVTFKEEMKSKENSSYDNLLAKRYTPDSKAEDTVLTYTIVENDVKNMIKDLLHESNKIKEDVILNLGCNLDDEPQKLNETITSENVVKENKLEKEEDVKYIIERILERVNKNDVTLTKKSVEDGVESIGDALKETKIFGTNDVCSKHQSIYYCHTNTFEHPRTPETIHDKKLFPVTISVRKLSPSKKSIFKSDVKLINVLEKSNNVLTNLYNDLCSYETVTYELDTTSSEKLFDNAVYNNNRMYSNILKNFSTTAFVNNNKSTMSTESATVVDSDTDTTKNNTSSKGKPSTFPNTSSMQKSSKFLDIKSSTKSQLPNSMQKSKRESDTESILEERIIKRIDFDTNENKNNEEASTSKNISTSHNIKPNDHDFNLTERNIKLTERISDLTTERRNDITGGRNNVTERRSLQIIQHESTEDEIEINDDIFHSRTEQFQEKPSQYSHTSKVSTRNRASTYVDCKSSSDDSIIIKRTPRNRIKKKESNITKIYSNKSLKSTESEGLLEYPTTILCVSNTNLELQRKVGHPNIILCSHYTEQPKLTTMRDKSLMSTTTFDSEYFSEEDYPADTEDTEILLPNLKYLCVSIPELNTLSEIRVIESNVEENQLLEEKNKQHLIINSEVSVISAKKSDYSYEESESISSTEPSKQLLK